MTEPFHISLFEGTLHADKIHVKIQTRKHHASSIEKLSFKISGVNRDNRH